MTDLPAGLLRLYTDEDARHGDRPIAEVIVQRAQVAGLAGATVLRGRLGFGASAVHAHRFLGVGDNPPVVVEIVDGEGRLRAFADSLADLHSVALITFERVEILYRSQASAKRSSSSE
jgi:hypothetical protein